MSEVQVNVKGPNELKLQITISTDKTVLDLKQAIASQTDVEADRQRLIFSGRVLKDEDTISTYKIATGNTIHMVKGAARSGGAASGSTAGAPPAQIPALQTGQNIHDPLTALNSHQGFGAMAGFNPFAGTGVNTNDPNLMQNMMDSPEFLQQMSQAMSNPGVIDQIIAMNPEMAPMAPQLRAMFQSDRFREIMSNPEQLRAIMQMSAAMRGAGGNPFGMFGGMGGGSSFPAPGVPTTGTTGTTGTANAQPAAGTQPSGTPNPGAPQDPFGMGDPAAILRQMQQMQALFGTPGAAGARGPGTTGASDLFGSPGTAGAPSPFGFGGFGAPPAAPADSRPPEERFQVQLQQLQDMGFSNAQQNVRALLATGGNVHSAIEYILGGGGL